MSEIKNSHQLLSTEPHYYALNLKTLTFANIKLKAKWMHAIIRTVVLSYRNATKKRTKMKHERNGSFILYVYRMTRRRKLMLGSYRKFLGLNHFIETKIKLELHAFRMYNSNMVCSRTRNAWLIFTINIFSHGQMQINFECCKSYNWAHMHIMDGM